LIQITYNEDEPAKP